MMNSSILILVFVHLCCLWLCMLGFGGCREIVCIPSERETLLKVKHHLKDPSNRLSSWNSTANSNCCQWAGVVCNNLTAHVLELHLYTSPFPFYDYDDSEFNWEAYNRWRFSGKINPCLVDLKHLNYLDLSGNDFESMPIPSFLGTMTSLTHLNLSNAGFLGNIPHQIGNLSNLQYLDLRYAANGTIPSQIGNLSNLLYLDLTSYHNSLFAENIHWLSNMWKLEYLSLEGANLSKSFHWLHTLQALPSLTNLQLSWCALPQYNEPSLLNFSSLLTLDLSAISYYSAISFVPKWPFGLKKLVSLFLNDNDFEGSIPDGIRNLTLLENLDLSENLFSSSIPDWLYGLHHLMFLNLATNKLQGTVSDVLGNLTSLVHLDLSYNQLEGPIPSSLGNLTSLVRLRLSNNKLEGPILSSLGNRTSLVHLDLSDNKLEGPIPSSLGNLTSLVRLRLSNNQFSGNPFESLRSLSKLSYLYIDGNHFEGVVKEDDLANLSRLKSFFASGNNFTLKVSPNWLPSFQLTGLDMSSWQLVPNFPSWIRSQNELQYLDMSNTRILDMNDFLCRKQDMPMELEFLSFASNNLSGKIPDCWIKWPNLRVVDLQSNHFVGNLPPSMGSLALLRYLNIRNNLLSGIFPTILKKNNRLIYLDLGANNLSGTIPTWVGERLLNIEFLSLRSNNFSGHIPNEICDIIFLQDLDLAQNSLSGNIPNCFNHLSAMLQKNERIDLLISSGAFVTRMTMLLWVKGRAVEYKRILGLVTNVDLSDNNLSGVIPREITDLDGLIYLNLSKNQLSGQIPASIGNMRLLESLDISRNQLSGEIPPTISNLSFLNKLDLSYNHLKGKIPTGTQIQSFEASNFVGNNLCGPPLPINCSSNQKIPDTDHIGTEYDGHGVNGFFVSVALGFVVGFWVVVAPLFIYRSWRYAYFCFLDDMWYKLQSYC